MHISFPADEVAAADDPGRRTSDHGRIVGAIGEGWIGDRYVRPASLQNFTLETLPEQRIRCYATGENDGASSELECGSSGLDRQRFDDRFLEGGGEIGNRGARRIHRRL